MSWKLILNKTAMFFMISAGLILFQFLFGSNNVIVGVGVIVQALVLLSVDMTIHPIKNTLKLLILNLSLGLCATIVPLNPWFGIFLNFAMVFITVSLLTNDLTTPTYFPFILTYNFMLMAAPVDISQLPLRFGALATGTLLIIALQLLFNRHKSAKISNSVFSSVADTIITMIDQVLHNSENCDLDGKISGDIRKMSQSMNERKKHLFFASATAIYKLNIAFCLERISLIVSEIGEIEKRDALYDACLIDLKEILSVFQTIGSKDVDASAFKQIGLDFIDRYQNANDSYIEIYELIQVIDILRKRAYKLTRIRGSKIKTTLFDGTIPKEYGFFHHIKKSLEPNSIRFSFALRVAIAIALTTFITHLFHLEFGRWMVFTAFIIIQPYAEDAKEKFRKRLLGTIFGFLIFVFLFTVVQDSMGRTLLMMLAGYISSYLKAYDKQVICITISALGAAAMAETGGNFFEIERIFYVIIGGLLAMLINKYILRFTLSDTTRDLQNLSIDVLQTVSNLLLLKDASDLMKNSCVNLLLALKLIEDKICFNNTILESEKLEDFIVTQQALINDFVFISFGKRYWILKDPQLFQLLKNLVDLLGLLPQKESRETFLCHSAKLEKALESKINHSTTSHEKVYLNALKDSISEIKLIESVLSQV